VGEPCAMIIDADPGLTARLEILLREASIYLLVASNFDEARKLMRTVRPAMLMLDFDQEARESIRFLGEIRDDGIFAPVLWLAKTPTTDTLERVQASGAQGVLPKAAGPNTVLRAVRAILCGDQFFPINTYPATPGAKALEESERLLKTLIPEESAS